MASPSTASSSDPAQLQRLLWRLRPTLRDLFAAYGVPEQDASTLLRETVRALGRDCDRIAKPRRWLLDTLEERCRAYHAPTDDPRAEGA